MTVLLSTEDGWIVSHLEYLNEIYKSVNDEERNTSLAFNREVFEINSQFLRIDQFEKSEERAAKIVDVKSKKRKRSNELSDEDLQQV